MNHRSVSISILAISIALATGVGAGDLYVVPPSTAQEVTILLHNGGTDAAAVRVERLEPGLLAGAVEAALVLGPGETRSVGIGPTQPGAILRIATGNAVSVAASAGSRAVPVIGAEPSVGAIPVLGPPTRLHVLAEGKARASVRIQALDGSGAVAEVRDIDLAPGELAVVDTSPSSWSVPPEALVVQVTSGRALVLEAAIRAPAPPTAPGSGDARPVSGEHGGLRRLATVVGPASTGSGTQGKGSVPGDVDGDGDVDAADLACDNATIFDPAVGCAAAYGDGDITAVIAGDGLGGGGDTGDVTLFLPDGAVTDVKLAPDAVVTDRIMDLAVTGDKLANGSVSEDKILDGAVTQPKLATVSPPSSGKILSWTGSALDWATDGLILPYAGVQSAADTAFEIHESSWDGTTGGYGTVEIGADGSPFDYYPAGHAALIAEHNSRTSSLDMFGIFAYGPSGGLFSIGDSLAIKAYATTASDAVGVQSTASGRAVDALSTGSAPGVYGESNAGDGVQGTASADDRSGVYGVTTNSTAGFGVYGRNGAHVAALGTWAEGLWASGDPGSTNQAGTFVGNVSISGNLNVGGTKNFRIDHPLDPANRFLLHAAVESSEVLDVYSGTVTLDADGTAWVTLPDWFEAINTDYRYQLTPVGAPAPSLHVARRIENNRFRIAGGEPGLEVSWQVTARRDDATLRRHPFEPEQDKPESERGRYVDPAALDRPMELQIGRRPGPPAPTRSVRKEPALITR